MNKLRPSERLVRLLAFSLSLLLYGGGITGVYRWSENLSKQDPVPVSMKAVNLSFAQMELTAVEETPPPPEITPPPEEADVALEEVIKKPEPEPVQANAQVTQEAAAPAAPIETDALLAWVLEQIEKEKYYPATAKRAGYEGTFDLLVTVGADGTISEAVVLSGFGHPLLRRSIEKMMGLLPGRSFGQPLGRAVEIPIEFEFELEN